MEYGTMIKDFLSGYLADRALRVPGGIENLLADTVTRMHERDNWLYCIDNGIIPADKLSKFAEI
jgi:hypothetical protein